jgi:hypothetical protein
MSSNGFAMLQSLLSPEDLRRMNESEELRVISKALVDQVYNGTPRERVRRAERAKRNRESVVRIHRT